MKDLELKRLKIEAFLLTGALFFSLFLFSCGGREGPSLVLITVDTLRADRLGCYGHKEKRTPNIDRLSEKGILFTRAYTPIPVTGPAHAAILTGRSPGFYGLFRNGLDLPEDLPTVAESFKKSGFETAAFVSAFPLHSRFGFARGFDRYDDEATELEGRVNQLKNHLPTSRKGEDTVSRALAWLESYHQRAFFVWVHLWEPHRPYQLHGEDRDRGEKIDKNIHLKGQVGYLNQLNRGSIKASEEDLKHISFLYDSEVGYTDRQVGRLMKGIEKLGIEKKTLIVFTADHGEALGEHGNFALHRTVPYDESLQVPLIFSWPGRLEKGKRIDGLVSLTDLAPAMAALLGSGEPSPESRTYLLNLLKGKEPEKREELFHQCLFFTGETYKKWHIDYILRTSQWKVVNSWQRKNMLFDLTSDPEESNNLWGEDEELQEILEKRLSFWGYRANFPRRSPVKRDWDRETLEKLKSLGYY